MFTKREVLLKAAHEALWFAGDVLAEYGQEYKHRTFRVPLDIVNGNVRRVGGTDEIPANFLRGYRNDERRNQREFERYKKEKARRKKKQGQPASR